MNFLNIFEDRISGIFGSSQMPFSFKKLAKQAARDMEDQTLVINGADTAPALYTVLISANDDALITPYYPQLAREVSEFVKAQANKKHYGFVGDPLVRFMVDPSLKSGKFSVFAENVDQPTLVRLREEEVAHLRGEEPSQGYAAATSRNNASMSSPGSISADDGTSGQQASARHFKSTPSVADDPFEVTPKVSVPDINVAPEPQVEAPIPVPKTMTREQLAGMGGAAAATAAAGGVAAAAAAGAAVGALRADDEAVAKQKNVTPSQPKAQLVDVVTGDTFDLTQARTVVGRERGGADIVLRDPNVSRRHAELSFTGSDWSIEDLGSTNGTLVNNRRVERCPLRNGDMLTFGLATFEFRG